MSFRVETFGNPDAGTILIQMVDDHDLEGMEQEVSAVRELSGKQEVKRKTVAEMYSKEIEAMYR